MKGVSLAYCKVDDGIPLRLWRGTVEIPASADMVLKKIWEERQGGERERERGVIDLFFILFIGFYGTAVSSRDVKYRH